MRLRMLWPETLVAGVCLAALLVPEASAVTSSSPNFQLEESSIGTSGLLESESTNYKISEATGDLGVGRSASNNFQVEAGSKTTPDPALSFAVDVSGTDFGDFSPTTTASTTLTFTVKNYTTYGYIVQIYGAAPTYESHTIAPMSVTAPPQVGIEQFGINLVANTSPTSVGANLDNGDFGQGSVEPDYSTTNNYRYVSGETIASASSDSGETTYTVTFIANVSPLTPGGKYNINQTLIATGTY